MLAVSVQTCSKSSAEKSDISPEALFSLLRRGVCMGGYVCMCGLGPGFLAPAGALVWARMKGE